MTERSNADNVGLAIALLTALAGGEEEAGARDSLVREAVYEIQRGFAESAGTIEGLARVALVILRAFSEVDGRSVRELIAGLAPRLQADALERDATMGLPPLGAAVFATMEPPSAAFSADELAASARSILRIAESYTEDEGASVPIRERRQLFEAVRIADHIIAMWPEVGDGR